MTSLVGPKTNRTAIPGDVKLPNFSASLTNLDRLPSRYTDNVFMLYVKDGVTKVDDILATQVNNPTNAVQ